MAPDEFGLVWVQIIRPISTAGLKCDRAISTGPLLGLELDAMGNIHFSSYHRSFSWRCSSPAHTGGAPSPTPYSNMNMSDKVVLALAFLCVGGAATRTSQQVEGVRTKTWAEFG